MAIITAMNELVAVNGGMGVLAGDGMYMTFMPFGERNYIATALTSEVPFETPAYKK